MSSLLREALDGLIAVAFAPSCAACQRLLDRPTSGAVCETCWSAVRLFPPPLCPRCGDPLPGWRVDLAILCSRCRSTDSPVDAARAVGPYDGTLRDIVHAIKYEGRRSLAGGVARLMRDHAADILAGADLAVPVPLHPRRRRRRGFNQAEDLARGLGLPVARALRRSRNTASQTALPAAERRQNVRGAFAPSATGWWGGRSQAAVGGRCILLVDDVSTTGATLDACARVLKQQGAREVRAVTAARVVSSVP